MEEQNPANLTLEESNEELQVDDSDEPLTWLIKLKILLVAHRAGLIIILTPIIFLFVPYSGGSPQGHHWCAYTLCIMATYWVTECIPLAVTALLPIALFPLFGIMSTFEVCKCYMNDTIVMFLGSILLALSIEQSGLHMRLALNSMKLIGYSHSRLLFVICFTTMFVSMWVSNTAATTMMVPINFAILKVFNDLNLLRIYEKDDFGNNIASDITSCYFCAATFSATIGGIGTLVGTSTNLVFKGLYLRDYANGTDPLSFPLFSAFTIPCMLATELLTYLYLVVVYFGVFRPKSAAAKSAYVDSAGLEAAKQSVIKKKDELGTLTYGEIMVIILFGGAILLFFSRSPEVFTGWGDKIIKFYGINDEKFILDSAVAILVCYLMFIMPSSFIVHKHFTEDVENLPISQAPSVLDWPKINEIMPYSFMFLLGGGFALSTAAKPEYTDLNGEIGKILKEMAGMHHYFIIFLIIILTTAITNFASNVAVCTLVSPIVMQLAVQTGADPLWFNLGSGLSSSYCYLVSVGTPGNLVVQVAANIPNLKMMKAGIGPTLASTFVTWLCVCFWAPVLWKNIDQSVLTY